MKPELTDRHSRPYKSSVYYLLLLLLGLTIAYWPISFHVLSLKNDALNYFLPVRRLVSESYHHGIVPLWTPYMNLGYPLHGDMQSGAWNPIVQLFSLFGPYTLYTLQLETLLYIYICGAGMFFLLRYFNIHPLVNLIISFAFMLCGFNSDSSQFLNWISGLAFLPFVFLFYYRFLHEYSFQTAVVTATFLYLLFVTAYPADFIITIYLMLAMFIWHFFGAFTKIELRRSLLKSLTLHFVIGVTFILLSLPAIISYMQALPLTERGSGASYNEVMSNPLHPFLVSSFVTPLSIWKMPGVEITDGLERNSYIGIIPFIFVVSAFFTRSNTRLTRFFKYAIIIFLLFSFGRMGGLRIVAYYLLPLMDTFRHPANARMFTIFFCCLLGAFTLDQYFKRNNDRSPLRTALLITTGFALLLVAFAIFSPFHGFESIPSGLSLMQTFKFLIDHLTFSQITIFNVIIQLPFLFFLWQWMRRKITHQQLTWISILNSILFAMLLQPHTVVKNESASRVQQMIDEHSVRGFPLPDLRTSLVENSKNGMKYFREIGTLNLYNKKVGRVDYRITPSNLLSQDSFWFKHGVRDVVMKYPLLYSADTAVTILDHPELATVEHKKIVFVTSQSLADSINSLSANVQTTMTAVSFLPNKFVFNIHTSDSAYFALTQNHFPYWKININGSELQPDKVNISFMGFMLPSGNHRVTFIYDATHIIVAWWFSMSLLVTIIIYSSVIAYRSRRSAV